MKFFLSFFKLLSYLKFSFWYKLSEYWKSYWLLHKHIIKINFEKLIFVHLLPPDLDNFKTLEPDEQFAFLDFFYILHIFLCNYKWTYKIDFFLIFYNNSKIVKNLKKGVFSKTKMKVVLNITYHLYYNFFVLVFQ